MTWGEKVLGAGEWRGRRDGENTHIFKAISWKIIINIQKKQIKVALAVLGFYHDSSKTNRT